MEPVRVVLSLIGIVIVIFAAYYATWYIGVKASGQGRSRFKNKNINILDRFAFSKDKSFCLVEIAGKVYVIGITNQSMTLLDTLEAEEFATETETGRRDSTAWHITSGDSITSRMTKRLAAFLAHKMGRQLDSSEDEQGATFAESMKNARKEKASGQPTPIRTERVKDPEDV